MTREEHLVFCKKCTNRDFNMTEGILCSLTGTKADFEDTCINYQLDKKTIIAHLPDKTIKPNKKRAALAVHMIWAVLIIDLFAIVSNYFQYRLLQDLNNGINISEADLTNNDLRVGLISVLYLIIYILSGITFIQWFRRAYNNLDSRTRVDHSEGWAAGAWFVPIICLFRPYKIMKELFEKTDRLIKDKTSAATGNSQMTLIGLWWALWIIVGYVGNYALKTGFNSDTIEGLSDSTIADIVSSFIEIPVGILAILIISAFVKKDNRLLQLEAQESRNLEAA